MTVRYFSVASGIEGATVAWRPLGWTPVGFSEIDQAASRVLAHHYGSNMPGEALASNGPSRSYVAQTWAVRRLTPRECERLQGFPDSYTEAHGQADGPRYKQLGNSFAVPVVRWIGKRIDDALNKIPPWQK